MTNTPTTGTPSTSLPAPTTGDAATSTPLIDLMEAVNDLQQRGYLTAVGRLGHDINIDRGWEVFTPADFPVSPTDRDAAHKVLAHVALLHSEASEATEAVRKMDKGNFAEELADVVIRLASLAYGLGLDLDEMVSWKLRKNANRPHRHGGKAI